MAPTSLHHQSAPPQSPKWVSNQMPTRQAGAPLPVWPVPLLAVPTMGLYDLPCCGFEPVFCQASSLGGVTQV